MSIRNISDARTITYDDRQQRITEAHNQFVAHGDNQILDGVYILRDDVILWLRATAAATPDEDYRGNGPSIGPAIRRTLNELADAVARVM